MSNKKCYICKEIKPRTEFYFNNKEKTKLQSKCKKCHNKIKREKKKEPILKIIENQRRRIRAVCRSKNFNKNKTFDLIFGINRNEFKIYMENLFYGGITWENYNDNFWEVDHIIPIANADSFDKLVELCHYTNLQPLLILDHKNKTKDK